MIITIDGPSGTGKTTVAKNVAEKLKFVFFDTGAMYRAFTWFLLENNVDVQDRAGVEQCLKEFTFSIHQEEGKKRYFVGEQDVTEVIRSRLITVHVSPVSALAEVRSLMVQKQREFAQNQDCVFEGRDLGTVVFPQAEVKVYLTADPQIRAERRLNEMLEKTPEEVRDLSRLQMLTDLMQRDEYDSKREIAPLRCPPDALQIDTTKLTIDQVGDRIVKYAAELFPEKILL